MQYGNRLAECGSHHEAQQSPSGTSYLVLAQWTTIKLVGLSPVVSPCLHKSQLAMHSFCRTTFYSLLVLLAVTRATVSSEVCSWENKKDSRGATCADGMESSKLKYAPPSISTSPLEVPAKILMGKFHRQCCIGCNAALFRLSYVLSDDWLLMKKGERLRSFSPE